MGRAFRIKGRRREVMGRLDKVKVWASSKVKVKVKVKGRVKVRCLVKQVEGEEVVGRRIIILFLDHRIRKLEHC